MFNKNDFQMYRYFIFPVYGTNISLQITAFIFEHTTLLTSFVCHEVKKHMSFSCVFQNSFFLFSPFSIVINNDIANNKPTKSAGMDLSEGSDRDEE